MKTKGEDRQPSIDEVIATINHSSLPVVFIEGKDDTVVFRNLEDRFFDFNLSIFPMGGRDRVLQLFKRRSEIHAHGKFCFIADQDTWVYSCIPAEFNDPLIIFTSGYSIENDIYVDGNLEAVLSRAELSSFCDELKVFLSWYSLALARHLDDDSCGIDHHPEHILGCKEFFDREMVLRDGEKYPEELLKELAEKYPTLLRGKSLFSLIIRQLSYKTRVGKHSKLGLMELVARKNGPLISRFSSSVETALGLTP